MGTGEGGLVGGGLVGEGSAVGVGDAVAVGAAVAGSVIVVVAGSVGGTIAVGAVASVTAAVPVSVTGGAGTAELTLQAATIAHRKIKKIKCLRITSTTKEVGKFPMILFLRAVRIRLANQRSTLSHTIKEAVPGFAVQ